VYRWLSVRIICSSNSSLVLNSLLVYICIMLRVIYHLNISDAMQSEVFNGKIFKKDDDNLPYHLELPKDRRWLGMRKELMSDTPLLAPAGGGKTG